MKKDIIVSNATPVIAFSRIRKLKLFQQIVGEIIIPEEIRNSGWIKVEKVKSKNDVELLLPSLDHGEAEVIVLAKELKADLVIIDELSI